MVAALSLAQVSIVYVPKQSFARVGMESFQLDPLVFSIGSSRDEEQAGRLGMNHSDRILRF